MCCLWRRAEQQLAEAPPAKARDPREGSDEALRRGLAASESSLALGATQSEHPVGPLAVVREAAPLAEVRVLRQLRQPQEATLGIRLTALADVQRARPPACRTVVRLAALRLQTEGKEVPAAQDECASAGCPQCGGRRSADLRIAGGSSPEEEGEESLVAPSTRAYKDRPACSKNPKTPKEICIINKVN